MTSLPAHPARPSDGAANTDPACAAETLGPTATQPKPSPPPDPWAALRQHTNARIALGRVGTSLPMAEVLQFGVAHAMARDAIHTPLDVGALTASLEADGWRTLRAHSQARSRHEYLLRPDLGRRLGSTSLQALQMAHEAINATGQTDAMGATRTPAPAFDLLLVLGDGLSPVGIQGHARPLLNVLREHLLRLPSPHLPHTPLRLGPVVVASQARVALGDDIAQALHAPMVAMLIGERPGLSSPDSVGIYLTLNPKVGCHDAQRNCISNVRPEGQPFASAAYRLAWLVQQAFKLGSTGVTLKDESDLAALDASAPALEPHT
jgi:ethanolamine ammonia-lyase small subunit